MKRKGLCAGLFFFLSRCMHTMLREEESMSAMQEGLSVPHRIQIENRTRVTITGVEDVDSFHEQEVDLATSAGLMRVTGQDLHIRSLNLEEGQLVIEGELDAVAYAPRETPREGLMARWFR